MFFKPEYVQGMVRIRSDKYASYHSYFHQGNNQNGGQNSGQNDPIYLKLEAIAEKHKKITKVDDESFKMPATNEGFYFKTLPNKIKCINSRGKPCIIDDLFESDAWCKFKVLPYDFTSNGVRIVGVSITLIEATGRKDP